MDFRIDTKDTYVHIVCSGTYDFHRFTEMIGQGIGLTESVGLRRGLVDIRAISGEIPIMDRFKIGELAARLANQLSPPALRFAVLTTEETIGPERFGETVGRNRGADMIVTTSLTRACEWLGIEPASVS